MDGLYLLWVCAILFLNVLDIVLSTLDVLLSMLDIAVGDVLNLLSNHASVHWSDWRFATVYNVYYLSV